MTVSRRHLSALALLPLLPLTPSGLRAASLPDGVRQALRDTGLVLLMRHAQTDPGIGDPPGFQLEQCRTQRNLSPGGRDQARRVGARLRDLGLTPHIVRSSAWCRCLDTAELAFGRSERWPPLNSFFDARRQEPAQTAELQRMLARAWPGHVEAWVTHMVNVTALTGEGVAMGEVLVLPRGAASARVLLRVSDT